MAESKKSLWSSLVLLLGDPYQIIWIIRNLQWTLLGRLDGNKIEKVPVLLFWYVMI